MASRRVSVTELFDEIRFTPYQTGICFLCFCVVLFDGFDSTIIGVTLPKIADFLHSSPMALGLAVAAGQVGPMFGAIVLGTLADRWGRKWMLFISVIIFGLFNLLTTLVTSVEQLALLRFLGGIGLGGALPGALAFGREYAPSRMRATLTSAMWAGMPFGAAIGGLSASYLIPRYGWQSLFILGGVAPVVIGLLVMLFLPESLEFLVRHGRDAVRIRKIVSRVSPTLANDEEVQFFADEEQLSGRSVKRLFSEGRAFTTVLLWVLFFLSFYLIWIMMGWSPTLLRKSGASAQQYSLAFAFMLLGTTVATLAIGRLMDQFNPFRMLKFVFVFAFISMVLFGFFASSPFIVIAVVSTVTGIFVFGGNSGVVALTTLSYPVDIRGSGIGWAYAFGKFGSLVAAAGGGLLISLNWSVSQICFVNAVPALLAMLAITILQRHIAAAPRSEVSEGAGSDTHRL